jgi:hypothetical protein
MGHSAPLIGLYMYQLTQHNMKRPNPKKDKTARRKRPVYEKGAIRTVTRGIKRPTVCAKCLLELEMTPEGKRDTKQLYPREHGTKYCKKHSLKVGQEA